MSLRSLLPYTELASGMCKREMYECMVPECNAARKAMLTGVLSDVIEPVKEWPTKQMRKFLCSHLVWADRCSLTYFVLGNGMPPSVYVDWCLAQPGYLANREAAKHLAELIKAWGKGDFDGTTGKEPKMIWNMALKEETPCHTPLFCIQHDQWRVPIIDLETGERTGVEYAMPGSHYWKKAAARLEAHAANLPKSGYEMVYQAKGNHPYKQKH